MGRQETGWRQQVARTAVSAVLLLFVAGMTCGAPAEPGARLSCKFYPYYSKVAIALDLATFPRRAEVEGVRVTVARGGRVIARDEAAVVRKGANVIVDTPELVAGQYEVTALLRGSGGTVGEPLTQTWTREVFPWEHNNLGKSATVIPPFTPLEVKGEALSCVLRDYALGETGLWDQVVSAGQPLLTGPMRWRVTVGDRAVTAAAGGLRVISARPEAVVTEGSFQAGAVEGLVRSEWDYDGLAKVRLRLEGPQAAALTRLSLEIPLRESLARYFHACGDGLRFNPAGAMPPGQGLVWDSSRGPRVNLVGAFFPYIWVGDGTRGVAWFADSDRGWGLDDQTPAVQLERQGQTLLLRVNFITEPTPVGDGREIVFGLQATPVKPMPTTPVSWRRWVHRSPATVPVQKFDILGSFFYWGGVRGELYPRKRDFSIFEAFGKARDTGQPDMDFVSSWLAGYPEEIKADEYRWSQAQRSIPAGMRSAASLPRGQDWLWIAYTNPRATNNGTPEWDVFGGEWLRSRERAPVQPGLAGFACTPVDSFQDAAMWYYREMLKAFDGIYWDNLYLSVTTDPVTSSAWVDEQGRVHPAMGIWAMRDLVKRTAVMMHELGRPAYCNVVHMTNANLVPVLAFATANLDWEWRYGDADFQDRFSPELTVAETIGRQTGTVPLILKGGLQATGAAADWTLRTRTGVCLVHEIRPWDAGPRAHNELLAKLFEWGYGGAECQVYNYWDENFPLETGNDALKGLVMVKGEKAVVIVTDYGSGGNCTVKLDLPRLSLPALRKVTDMETGEPVACAGPGQATFTLKQHDYKVLAFE